MNDIAALIEKSGVSNHDELQREFKQAIESLIQKGTVHLKPDHELGGDGLKVRVRLILEGMGLTVRNGRENLEDLVVPVPEFAGTSIPLVIEVKSGKAPSPTREHLRQLDDWVFELSGEEAIRQRSIINQGRVRGPLFPGTGTPMNISPGAIQPSSMHPSPHKGILLYNGPLGQPIEQRTTPMLNQNEVQFAQVRSFCVISLPCLLSWSDACKEDSRKLKELWSHIQECAGELEHAV